MYANASRKCWELALLSTGIPGPLLELCKGTPEQLSGLEGVGGGAGLVVDKLAHKAYFSKFLKNTIWSNH